MKKVIILRYSEIYLKGNNKYYFEKKLFNNAKEKLEGIECDFERIGARYIISNYAESDENDIIVNSKYAEHIIVIGKEVSDFILSCPDDIFHKLTIFYNKVDESPISLVRFKKIKREIISLLNSNGWNLPLDFNRFYMGSIKYDMFYEKLQSEEVDTNDFIMSNSYYMWDKYGLPCPRNKYNSETIINFLKEIYVASRLLPTKQEYQRGVR